MEARVCATVASSNGGNLVTAVMLLPIGVPGAKRIKRIQIQCIFGWHVGMSLGLSSCVNLKKSYCPLSCRSCLLRLAWDPAVCPLALWCSFLVSAACLGVFPVVVPVPLPLHVRARTAWLKSKVGGLLAVGFR